MKKGCEPQPTAGTDSSLVADPASRSAQPAASSHSRERSIHVVAGAVFDAAGRILVAERPAGKHMAGRWEFPGGKAAAGETPEAALIRELKEELGIEVHATERLICYEHEYPDRRVLLDLWHVTRYAGTPQSCEGQRLDWVAVKDLEKIDLLEADRPMVEVLKKLA